MIKFYLHDGLAQCGPFTIEQLKDQGIKPETSVWAEGMSDWTQAKNITSLTSLFQAPPPFRNQTTAPPVPQAEVRSPVIRNRKLMYVGIGAAVISIAALFMVYLNAKEETAIVQSQITEIKQGQNDKDDEKQKALEALSAKNRNYRNNWERYFAATHNQYTYREIGGISNLEIIFSNSSEYMADEMVAEVSYIKSNGELWQVIGIPCYNVPANGNKSVAVADVNRCTSVNVSVSSISSKKMHFYFGGNYNSGNAEDPYFAK